MSIPKKIGRALLFPHIAIVIPLVPVSVALLIYSFAFDGVREAVRYFAYALSAYTLAVVCFRTPALIRRIRSFQSGNGFAGRWANDVGLRVKVSLYGSLLWNTAYTVFQLGLGVYHSALWFYAMAAYYLLLAVMRFFLLRHARIYRPGERMRDALALQRRERGAFNIYDDGAERICDDRSIAHFLSPISCASRPVRLLRAGRARAS